MHFIKIRFIYFIFFIYLRYYNKNFIIMLQTSCVHENIYHIFAKFIIFIRHDFYSLHKIIFSVQSKKYLDKWLIEETS